MVKSDNWSLLSEAWCTISFSFHFIELWVSWVELSSSEILIISSSNLNVQSSGEQKSYTKFQERRFPVVNKTNVSNVSILRGENLQKFSEEQGIIVTWKNIFREFIVYVWFSFPPREIVTIWKCKLPSLWQGTEEKVCQIDKQPMTIIIINDECLSPRMPPRTEESH